MGTRAAAFGMKIRNLRDFHLKLLQGSQPPSASNEIANTLKFFTQTLLNIMKDVSVSPLELIKNPQKDSTRICLFPNLDYKELFVALINLLDVSPIQQNVHVFAHALFQCVSCIISFLDGETIESVPYLLASSLARFPKSLHKSIINALCYYLLPFILERNNDNVNKQFHAVNALLMTVFNAVTNFSNHCQLVETLMSIRTNLSLNLMSIISYGTNKSRTVAVKILFYYFPPFDHNLFDRKSLLSKIADSKPFACQRDICPNAGNAEASKMCLNHSISISFASDCPPPLYLCIECANEIYREHSDQTFYDILHPIQQISMICENKNCRSNDKLVASICFSMECATYNGNRPIRYCNHCHNNKHNARRGSDHVFHKCIPKLSQADAQMKAYIVESILNMLKNRNTMNHGFKDSNIRKTTSRKIDENNLLTRYGIWLLVGLCPPKEIRSDEILANLLSALFYWFRLTAYSYDGKMEVTLEKLKTGHISDWIKNVITYKYNTFISCLLPYPPDSARISGHWCMLLPRILHLKEGLNQLFCLVPYEIINEDIWNVVMAHWMEALVNDVPEKDIFEVKSVLNKLLDNEMSPLGFEPENMFRFISVRFQDSSTTVKKQALTWLQVLSNLGVTVPLPLIFAMFEQSILDFKKELVEASEQKGVKLVRETYSFGSRRNSMYTEGVWDHNSDSDNETKTKTKEINTEIELNLSNYVVMLDIIIKQADVHKIEKHAGIHSMFCRDTSSLLKLMITSVWCHSHVCSSDECNFCDSSVTWHQLMLELILFISEKNSKYIPEPFAVNCHERSTNRTIAETERKMVVPVTSSMAAAAAAVAAAASVESHSITGALVQMPNVCSLMTATVETISEQCDYAAIVPIENNAMNKPLATSSDSDTNFTTAHGAGGGGGGDFDDVSLSKNDNYWQTSAGNFKFSLDELPQHLQLIYYLINTLITVNNRNIVYTVSKCLNAIVLHSDVFSKAAKKYRGFFLWLQENLLIDALWKLCDSDVSHISEQVVPVLMHCITLPSGSEIFLNTLHKEFQHVDWKVRFHAVERVTVIVRFVDKYPIKSVFVLQFALTNVFCYLIQSMDDKNAFVAQRASLNLGTLHDVSIRIFINCFEAHFNLIIIDRPMLLHSLYQLHNALSDRKILTWEFFLNRFDVLHLESQIRFNKQTGETLIKDLMGSDMSDEYFLRKIRKAHDALEKHVNTNNTSKTLADSFRNKSFYKRAMSAPDSTTAYMPKSYAADVPKDTTKQNSQPLLKKENSQQTLNMQFESIDDFTIKADDESGENSNTNGGGGGTNATNNIQNRHLFMDDVDKETIHLLIFLLMQFLSRPDQTFVSIDKELTRTQKALLDHVSYLLGYDTNENRFRITASVLRQSTIFNAFMWNIQQLLDQNHDIGKHLLLLTLNVLHFAPIPFDNVTDCYCNYSLWILEPYQRYYWLMTFFVILYKYNYEDKLASSKVVFLIKIVINTINEHNHVCKPIFTNKFANSPSKYIEIKKKLLQKQCTENDDDPKITQNLSAYDTPILMKFGKSYGLFNLNENTEAELQSKLQNILKKQTNCFDDYDTKIESIDCHRNSIANRSFNTKRSHRNSINCGLSNASNTIANELKQIAPKTKKPKKENSVGGGSGGGGGGGGGGSGTGGFLFSRKESCSSAKTAHLDNYKMNVKEGIKMIVSSSIIPNKNLMNVSPLFKQLPTSLSSSVISLIDMNAMRTTTAACDSNRNIVDGQQQPQSQSQQSTGKSDMETSFDRSNDNDTDEYLEVPQHERLLPVGALPQPQLLSETLTIAANEPTSFTSVLDKVNEILGISINDVKLNDKIKSDKLQPNLKRLRKQSAFEAIDDHFVIGAITSQSLTTPATTTTTMTTPTATAKTTNTFLSSSSSLSNAAVGTAAAARLKNSKIFAKTKRRVLVHEYKQNFKKFCSSKLNQLRIGDSNTRKRCVNCNEIVETYSESEIGLCFVILENYIRTEPNSGAFFLADILRIMTSLITSCYYPWQRDVNVHLPGCTVSTANQFLRCVLYQLAPNGIFVQLFQIKGSDAFRTKFFRTISESLVDFSDLNPLSPLRLLLEFLNSSKTFSFQKMPLILQNVNLYLNGLPIEVGLGPVPPLWINLLNQMEQLFRKLILFLDYFRECSNVILKLMIYLLRIPGVQQIKNLVDHFSKITGQIIQKYNFETEYLMDLCYSCNQAFHKDRDKQCLSRVVTYQFGQALKFKVSISQLNLMKIIRCLIQDFGVYLFVTKTNYPNRTKWIDFNLYTNASIVECMRQHIHDVTEFLADPTALVKLKSDSKYDQSVLMDGAIKSAVAQFLTVEISHHKDQRSITRYLPWLYNTGPIHNVKDSVDCLSHIRLLCWLLLGSLLQTSVYGQSGPCANQPIPADASCQIADHVQISLTAFVQQLNIASSFNWFVIFYYTITLCELWTLYLEYNFVNTSVSLNETNTIQLSIMTHFWTKVTPCFFQLISNSRTIAELTSLKFLKLMQLLLKCNSAAVIKLFPIWKPIFYFSNLKVPKYFKSKINQMNAACEMPLEITDDKLFNDYKKPQLLKWLIKIQMEMARIEMQSSRKNFILPFNEV